MVPIFYFQYPPALQKVDNAVSTYGRLKIKSRVKSFDSSEIALYSNETCFSVILSHVKPNVDERN